MIPPSKGRRLARRPGFRVEAWQFCHDPFVYADHGEEQVRRAGLRSLPLKYTYYNYL